VLTADPVGRFLDPTPSTVQRFRRFVQWSSFKQRDGGLICFALIPDGSAHAAGLIQVRRLEPSFSVAEWGFAIGQPYWGTGLFMRSADAVLSFLFETVRIRRLEARVVVDNVRAAGALRKLGFRDEAVLPRGFRGPEGALDQTLWSMLRADWRRRAGG
jgi:ribosomal-protein-alanine N-acetyltransferase